MRTSIQTGFRLSCVEFPSTHLQCSQILPASQGPRISSSAQRFLWFAGAPFHCEYTFASQFMPPLVATNVSRLLTITGHRACGLERC